MTLKQLSGAYKDNANKIILWIGSIIMIILYGVHFTSYTF